MAELKPCPFCGDNAFLAEWTYDLTLGNVLMHFVECNGCHAITFEYDTEEEAIKAWNRRAEDGGN